MRNFLNVHGASVASDAAAPLAVRVETGRQLLETGRVHNTATLTDAGDSSYNENSCLTVGKILRSIARCPHTRVCQGLQTRETSGCIQKMLGSLG